MVVVPHLGKPGIMKSKAGIFIYGDDLLKVNYALRPLANHHKTNALNIYSIPALLLKERLDHRSGKDRQSDIETVSNVQRLRERQQ
ncbi:hypothetical protein GGP99_003159 [Salinibacter ruber]|uniref:Uncharacterized protein n=1 Tax=Salinibacter ruber TaxID=146919 RepID=A0AAW5PC60_9BACT|nr:hypothetical protein [Salinibacter ruber]MCS4223282.1 hypothetical protein [Salinibacter ruber]